MLGYAQHCKDTYKDDVDDMSACLENLRAMIAEQYHFFLPEDDKASSCEQTLPLFRMYGQLFVDTILDQIHVAKKRGRNSLAAAHAQALITKVAEFKAHALAVLWRRSSFFKLSLTSCRPQTTLHVLLPQGFSTVSAP